MWNDGTGAGRDTVGGGCLAPDKWKGSTGAGGLTTGNFGAGGISESLARAQPAAGYGNGGATGAYEGNSGAGGISDASA
jgi:hypothetical protein